MLTGRNEPCPCGSGKKYKKCCLDKAESVFDNRMQKNPKRNELLNWLKRYDKKDLLVKLSSLQLIPENIKNRVRLQVLLQELFLLEEFGTEKVDLSILVKNLSENQSYLNDRSHLEDPPENLFTENLTFHDGNYCVYSGGYESDSFVLQNLLKGIFIYSSEFDKKVKDEMYESVMAMLFLSDLICERAGHSKWITLSEVQYTKTLNSQCNFSKDNPNYFSQEELITAFKEKGLNIGAIRPFLVNRKTDKLDVSEFHEHAFSRKPLVIYQDGILVINPFTILQAIRHYLIVMAIENNVIKQVVRGYKESSFAHLKFCLKSMKYEPVYEEEPFKNENAASILCQIDTDKHCRVLLLFDTCIGYESERVVGFREVTDKAIGDYLNTVIESFENEKESLLMIVDASLGRGMKYEYGPISINVLSFSCTLENLSVISKLRDVDSLTIWRFSKKLEEMARKRIPIIAFSELDKFAAYKRERESFYFSDDFVPQLLTINPGDALPMREMVSKKWDIHNVLSADGKSYVEVCKGEDAEFEIPIYVPMSPNAIEVVVEGYEQPIWITVIGNNETSINIYSDILQSVAYWVWQITPTLKPLLECLNKRPIRINLNLSDMFGKESHTVKSDPNELSFPIKISKEIERIMIQPDNQADRVILLDMLKGFNLLLHSIDALKIISDKNMSLILEKHAPLGAKKKFFAFVDKEHPILIPNNLVAVREIKDFDAENELDGLADLLRKRLPTLKLGNEFIDKADYKKVFDEVKTIHLERIRNIAGEYNVISLMRVLISQLEVQTNKREYLQISIPSSVACYGNVDTKIKLLSESAKDSSQNHMAIRTILEILVAEPPNGTKKVISDSVLQKLMATSLIFLEWGLLAEDIRCGVSEHQVGLLKSNRLGYKRDGLKWMQEFFDMKISEGVIEKISQNEEVLKHTNKFPKSHDSEFLDINNAFLAEYKVTYEEILVLTQAATLIGVEWENSSPILEKSEFINKISEMCKIEIDKTKSWLDSFSLKNRNSWSEPPAGYSFKDIEPWKFGRRLSLVTRPFLEVAENGKAYILWSPRHLSKSISQLFFWVYEGDVKESNFNSSEMQKYIGDRMRVRGSEFEKTIKNWVEQNYSKLVFMREKIDSKSRLKAGKDLGDIDVLFINLDSRAIFICECKSIDPGRTPSEVGQEIDGLLEDDKSKMKKHLTRIEWIENNIQLFSKVFNLSLGEWTLVPLFITSEEIPTGILKKLPIPLISFTSLKNEGGNLLESIASQSRLKFTVLL